MQDTEIDSTGFKLSALISCCGRSEQLQGCVGQTRGDFGPSSVLG